MALIPHLYRLVWSGSLFALEGWSCSMHITSDAGINLASSNFLIPLDAWFVRPESLLSSAAKLTTVKFNEINPVTGLYTGFSAVNPDTVVDDTPPVGGNGPGMGQLSLAVTTTTALKRGRGHAGRFYPPTGLLNIGATDGRITSAQASDNAISAATLIRDINTVVGAGSRCVVFSKAGQLAQDITGVKVGRVVDTMRSRRTSLLEEHVPAAL